MSPQGLTSEKNSTEVKIEREPIVDATHGDSLNAGGNVRPQNSFETASFFSKLFFMWPHQLMKEGMLRTLTEIDLPNVMETEASVTNRNYFEKLWQDEVHRVEELRKKLPPNSKKLKTLRPSLHWALAKDFFKTTWVIQPLMFANCTARIVMSLALGYLIESFEKMSNDGYIWAGVLIFCNLIVLFEHHHVFLITWRKGMQIRIGAVASIFAKTLRLNSIGGSDAVPSGKIMNLVSNDVERFIPTALFISYLIWAPLSAIAILIIGMYLIGPAFACGFGLLIFVTTPMQFYLSRRFAILRSRVATITDTRMTLVSQTIVGVRVMKMSGWEKEFEKRIADIRKMEVKQIHKANGLKALNEALFFSVNILVSIVVFLCYVFFFDGILNTRLVFTIFSLTNILQLELTKHLSFGVMSGAECWVSIRRIQQFFEEPELIEKQVMNTTSSSNLSSIEMDRDIIIRLSNVTCYWDVNRHANSADECMEDTTRSTMALEDVSVDLKVGELICVVGSVGSGKSALLSSIVGELSVSKGSIFRSYDSLAYASQDPWIMNGNIKENILMGKEMDPQYYDQVIKACGLTQDFAQFMHGDETMVGDRGVQCSGGQRARLGLARALYRDADIIVLDDPLSAVDSRVGRLIFYSAIMDLMVKKGKCVVLATHQHQYIGNSRCIFMCNGKIRNIGSFSECVELSDGNLHFVSHNADDSSEGSNGNDEKDSGDLMKKEIAKNINSEDVAKHMDNDASKQNITDNQEETKFNGVVSRATFFRYGRAMGGIGICICLLVLFAITQALMLGNVVAIGRWSELEAEQQKSRTIILVVVGLGGAVILSSLFRSLACFALTIRASKRLHDAMTESVLRAKIVFFDTNPSGRILNRFSADVGSNDDLLPHTLFDFLMCFFLVFGSIITACTAVPAILLAFPPLIWYFMKVRTIFVTTSRELKRFESMARSPIFAMLGESISGIATIRSNGCKKYFENKFSDSHDAHGRAFWSFLGSSRWLGFRMDSLMFVACSLASILAVLFSQKGWIGVDPVVFGLALSMLIQLGSIFQWTIRQSAEVVNQMVSVERVSEYSNIEPEPPLHMNGDNNKTWPEHGCIVVKDLTARYRKDLPPTLRGVSFTIEAGKRVGICGRTGSGKSTLVQSLFRILEAECGSIHIDGVDIQTLGLHHLRTGMSVINQHPVLFSGCTIRENLDPFHSYSDEAIIDALTDVQMIQAVHELPDGMNSIVAEGGSNFSVGQRQLLCLSRAILQKSKILVLDEASANVDGRTDQLLQHAVNKSFQESTIVSVAHRLDTIIDNDLILVLGNGEVLEYGTPAELISRNGALSQMVDDTGEELSRELRRRANASKNS